MSVHGVQMTSQLKLAWIVVGFCTLEQTLAINIISMHCCLAHAHRVFSKTTIKYIRAEINNTLDPSEPSRSDERKSVNHRKAIRRLGAVTEEKPESESDRSQNKSHTKVNQFHSFHVPTFIIPTSNQKKSSLHIGKACSRESRTICDGKEWKSMSDGLRNWGGLK